MKISRVLAILMLFQTFSGCDYPGRDQEMTTAYRTIINGEPDTDPAHEGVVALVTQSGFMFCSGVVIAPRVVITEAHCMVGLDPSDLLVSVGPRVADGTRLGVEEIFTHPDYTPGDGVEPSFSDLALLRLSQSVGEDVTPLKLLPEELKLTPDDIGSAVTFVGYGKTENDTTGTKMKVGGMLGWMCTTEGGCNQGLTRVSQNSICFNMHEAGTCSGDSGGPALIIRNNTEYIAGLTSYGDVDCALYGCDTKVDEYLDWLNGLVAGTLGSDCSIDSDCDSANCKDGVCCVPDCEGACLSCAIPGSYGDCAQAPDGQPCPDGDPCNGDEVCSAGVCLPGGIKDCDDSNPCTIDSCENTGCSHEPEPEGTICDDSDLCVGVGKCRSGYCEFEQASECDDKNECTQDTCTPAEGCKFAPLADGTVCDAGACGQAKCIGGQCTVEVEVECDDGNPCTKDFCNPDIGCMAEQKDDGTACGECGICITGECEPGPNCKNSCGCSQDPSATSLFLLGLLLVYFTHRGCCPKKTGREGRG